MKDYEKIALGIGITAIGIAAYQAWMQKEAVDQNPIKDVARSPIVGAKNMIGGAVNTGRNFIGGLIHTGSTGANEVKNRMFSGAAGIYNAGTNTGKYFRDTGSNGLKYVYDKGIDAGNALREGGGWFFTKSKDVMGNTYESARAYVPDATISIGGLSGLFHAKKTKKPIGKPVPPSENKTQDWMNSFMHPQTLRQGDL